MENKGDPTVRQSSALGSSSGISQRVSSIPRRQATLCTAKTLEQEDQSLHVRVSNPLVAASNKLYRTSVRQQQSTQSADARESLSAEDKFERTKEPVCHAVSQELKQWTRNQLQQLEQRQQERMQRIGQENQELVQQMVKEYEQQQQVQSQQQSQRGMLSVGGENARQYVAVGGLTDTTRKVLDVEARQNAHQLLASALPSDLIDRMLDSYKGHPIRTAAFIEDLRASVRQQQSTQSAGDCESLSPENKFELSRESACHAMRQELQQWIRNQLQQQQQRQQKRMQRIEQENLELVQQMVNEYEEQHRVQTQQQNQRGMLSIGGGNALQHVAVGDLADTTQEVLDVEARQNAHQLLASTLPSALINRMLDSYKGHPIRTAAFIKDLRVHARQQQQQSNGYAGAGEPLDPHHQSQQELVEREK